MEADKSEEVLELVYAVVNNIPASYHSADLRVFFSQFVETKGFDCFHFRHRPEKQSFKTSLTNTDSDNRHAKEIGDAKTYCCIIRVTEVKYNELMRTYHQRNWQNGQNTSASKCLISRLKTSTSGSSNCSAAQGEGMKYQARRVKNQISPDREEFTLEDLLQLPELRPPTVMPNGNVGTPTMHFMKLIQECKLPPSIIKKLQLDFPKSRNKGKYGSVSFDYQTESTEPVIICDDNEDGSDHVVTEESELSVHHNKTVQNEETNAFPSNNSKASELTLVEKEKYAPNYKEKRLLKKLAKRERRQLMAEKIEEKMIAFEKAGSESEDDNDLCEEWERHEALYDDVTNQGRNKDRLFEEEMEVVWEKGGSGLVFYTDAQYWHEKEGDFDEQTADDLDVDMSAYYEAGAGDHDIRDFVTIRQEQRRRRGIDKTDRFSAGIGKFECHTKGFGRKILEKQGWIEGSGLGSSVSGIADALENEGQHPRNRKGLGYRGEKLVRYGFSASKKRKVDKNVLISTVYDNPSETDPIEPLIRRNDPSFIKHRNRIT